MAIARSQLLNDLEPGLNALFGLEYDRYDNEHAEIVNKNSIVITILILCC